MSIKKLKIKKKVLTSHRTVSRPRRNRRPPLVKQNVGGLLAHFLVSHGLDVAVVKTVPQAIYGVLTICCKGANSPGCTKPPSNANA